jgi:hypothetical protein
MGEREPLAKLIRAWQSCGQASQEEVLGVLCTQEIGPGAAPAHDLLEALHCMELAAAEATVADLTTRARCGLLVDDCPYKVHDFGQCEGCSYEPAEGRDDG